MKNFYLLLSVFICILTVVPRVSSASEWEDLLARYELKPAGQSYCLGGVNGAIGGNRVDAQVNPASVTKLYITLWALEKLGARFQFETKVYRHNNNIYIVGSGDPYLVSENILLLMMKLNALDIRKASHIYFSDNLYFNWQDREFEEELWKHFNTSVWLGGNDSLNQALTITKNEMTELGMDDQFKVPDFRVKKVLGFNSLPEGAELVTKLTSAQVYRQLKGMNMFSNNFYSQKIFELLGGSSKLIEYLKNVLGDLPSSIIFNNGSGLPNNFTTCRLTILMLKKLWQIIDRSGLAPSDLIAVPRSDEGTLADRIDFPRFDRAVWAKTGTLNTVSTLAGAVNTINGPLFFGFFNTGNNHAKMRNLQDEFLDIISPSTIEFDYEGFSFSPLEGESSHGTTKSP